MRLGVHVSIAGGFLESVKRAEQLSCTTMQIFSRSPRGGQAPEISSKQAKQFTAARRKAGIDPLVIHGPYIINLASPEPKMWSQSASLFQEEVDRAVLLRAQYLVVHVGSDRGAGEAVGIAQVAKAINQVLSKTRGTVMILLENTAGSGQGLGAQFSQLAKMRKQITAKSRIGVCLDTAHLFAAGYAIHTSDGLNQTLSAL